MPALKVLHTNRSFSVALVVISNQFICSSVFYTLRLIRVNQTDVRTSSRDSQSDVDRRPSQPSGLFVSERHPVGRIKRVWRRRAKLVGERLCALCTEGRATAPEKKPGRGGGYHEQG